MTMGSTNVFRHQQARRAFLGDDAEADGEVSLL